VVQNLRQNTEIHQVRVKFESKAASVLLQEGHDVFVESLCINQSE
jgi:hypothetical protein